MKNKILLLGIVVILVVAVLTGCSAVKTTQQANANPAAPAQPANSGAAVQAQPVSVNWNSQQNGIWVNGEGKVAVVPDVAIITLGVSAQTSTVAESQSQAATAMDKVVSALKNNGVADKDIQTQNFSISQVMHYDDKTQQDVVTGYVVSNTVVAKLRDISKVGATIDIVVTAGGNYIRFNGINFTIDKPEQYYGQAREQAMKNAKDKADQLAKLSGITLGLPTYITENTYIPATPAPIMFKADMAASGAAPTTSISAGEMDVTVNVQITYSIK
jgi:uncharacterized protein